MRPPPKLQSGSECVDQMKELDVTLGKHPETIQRNKSRSGDKVMLWKKKSIFFNSHIGSTYSYITIWIRCMRKRMFLRMYYIHF